MRINFSDYPYGLRARVSEAKSDYKMNTYHLHEWYEIFLVIEGVCKFAVGDKIYALRAGDTVLLPPDKPHYTMGGEYTRIDVEITPGYINTFFTEEARDILLKCFNNKEILHLSSSKTGVFKNCCMEISSQKDDESLFILAGFLLRLLCNESDAASAAAPSHSPHVYSYGNEKLKSIVDYIEENYKDIRSLDETARACYVSKSHMCRMFRRELGISVVDYVNSVKLRHACSMLSDTSMSIVDIAVECGFNSSQYFSRIFKAFSGCTPQQYRKRTRRDRHP